VRTLGLRAHCLGLYVDLGHMLRRSVGALDVCFGEREAL
jgi:hypothetical protein